MPVLRRLCLCLVALAGGCIEFERHDGTSATSAGEDGGDPTTGAPMPVVECDPLAQDCPEGQACALSSQQFACVTVSVDGAAGDACVAAGECGAGLACRSGICGILQGPFKVAPEEAWVMGDNRNNSHDSRSWRGGMGAGVPFENIKGRAMFVWMSFSQGGGIAQDRLFVNVMGRPTLPSSADPNLRSALEKCLSTRPPVAQTTPPPPKKR